MGNTDAEWIWIICLFFGLVGFVTPFINEGFGGVSSDSHDITTIGENSALGVLNAITSILFWTFGIPAWVNIIVFIPLRIMMWFIVLRNTPFVGTGGS